MRVRWRWVAIAMLVVATAACFRSPTSPVIIGNFRCPVDGSRYTDDYGPRGTGFHYGIDMRAPTGTTVWAVKPGNVHYATENAGGLVTYLFADGGNVYYYAHLSGFIGGGDRRVAQGDALGLVGESGNATAPHLHFEIRLGSVTAHGIDPYPTLKNAGC
jgi:murein DD-endopeptidase MepM/ murein hydrolase activator NlpD